MNNQKKCIYCGTTENLTESDIIPNALVASRILNKCVCKRHNSGMTEKFESEVAEKLAFITNYLNIKSSKSDHYPHHKETHIIDGIEYISKKQYIYRNFINKKMLWDCSKTHAIGDIKTIKNIAKSKCGDDSNVKNIDLNNKILETNIGIGITVFFSNAMFHQVAKIAYEWYCVKNKVEDRYDNI